MKHATLSAAAALFITGSLILACASSEDTPPDAQPTQAAPATEPAPSGTGAAAKPPPPPDCTSTKCTADSDCATACGGSGGIGCCDTHVGTCFKSSATSCPAPTPDDAGMTGGY